LRPHPSPVLTAFRRSSPSKILSSCRTFLLRCP
jgi:hypothetical protein